MTRKPKIEYYWRQTRTAQPAEADEPVNVEHVVNWRLVGANGEIMCQSTQGFRDKTDARRSVYAVQDLFTEHDLPLAVREVRPGRKP